MNKEPLLSVRGLKTYFPVKKEFLQKQTSFVRAVDGVDFDVFAGEVFGLVGESGCGKTTLARTICRLYQGTEGQIFFEGRDILNPSKDHQKSLKKKIQMIFQDPNSSLNPRLTIQQILEEPLKIHRQGDKAERKKRICEIMQKVGLDETHLKRFPHQFSGGQRQRIGIARALILNPKLVLCDEAVSALDVSVQSQILNLLKDIQETDHLTYLFVSHDLSVVQHLTHRVAIMYLGEIVEMGLTEEVFNNPKHPYTQALQQAIPQADPRNRMKTEPMEGEAPSPINPPSGCRFHGRCKQAMPKCSEVTPQLKGIEKSQHKVACHLFES